MTADFRAQYQWAQVHRSELWFEGRSASAEEVEAAYAAAHPPPVTAGDVIREVRLSPATDSAVYHILSTRTSREWYAVARTLAQQIADQRNTERRAKALVPEEPAEDDGWVQEAMAAIYDCATEDKTTGDYLLPKGDSIIECIREAYAARVKP